MSTITQVDPAIPEYDLGEEVIYRDHTKRHQQGEIIAIEARWGMWSHKPEAWISYTVTHPTYRNRRVSISADWIIGRAQ